MLKPSYRDDSNTWSNIGFVEEISIIEITRTGTEGDKNTPKPGHGHGINTDKPKQNSLSHITMKFIEFSFRKSIPVPDHILAKSKGHNSTMI